jgi:hypothetical protein
MQFTLQKRTKFPWVACVALPHVGLSGGWPRFGLSGGAGQGFLEQLLFAKRSQVSEVGVEGAM